MTVMVVKVVEVDLPASDGGDGACGRVASLSWEGDIADGRALGERGGQVPESDILIGLAGVVRWVDDDLGDTDLLATGSPGLQRSAPKTLPFFWGN